jgi:hypothetical protein
MDFQYILLNVDKPDFRYEFHPSHPLILGKNPEIGLKSVFLWYTYPNISEKYENNRISIIVDGVKKEILIPKGMYEIEGLSTFLNKECFRDNMQRFIFGVNSSTFKCYVKLTKGIQIDLSKGNLFKLLGLEAKLYDKLYEEGTHIINITRGVDRIFIRSSLVERSYQYEMRDILFDILPFAEPGSAIQERPEKIEFYPCKDSTIRHIEIKITDSFGNLIDLTEPISIKLVFKSQKSLE